MRHAGDGREDEQVRVFTVAIIALDRTACTAYPDRADATGMLTAARHRAGAGAPTRTRTSMSQRAQRLIEAARRLPVPEGTYAVGVGLLISGITAYGFQILAFRGLSKTEYAALNGLWILRVRRRAGFFLPLEQEVGRAVADRRADGEGGGPSSARPRGRRPRSPPRLIVFTLVWALVFPLVDRLFHGQEVLLVCFVIGLVTYAVQFLPRADARATGASAPTA